MTVWQGFVLGLVQGLTEFIPVSSTAHLRIVPALLGWEDPGAAFSAVIQLGTLGAALAYFAADIARLTRAALAGLAGRAAWRRADTRLAWAIALGNVPIVVLGLGLRHFIEGAARSLTLIGAMLILVGLLLAVADRVGSLRFGEEGLTLRRVFAIGLFQSLALIPGASRSGSTILGGLLLGLRRADATRFSFLLGLPAILGAGVFQLGALAKHGAPGGWLPLAAGLVAAAVSGYWSIGFLLRYLGRHRADVFVVYRVLLGLAMLALAWRGLIQ
jgi:undecaprenyl-diphosphatase